MKAVTLQEVKIQLTALLNAAERVHGTEIDMVMGCHYASTGC